MIGKILRNKYGRIVVLVLLLIVVAVVLILTNGGIPGRYAVISGTNYDYLNPFENIATGTHTLYTRNVHDMGFCTRDSAILDAAKKYADRELFVAIEYRSINTGDIESVGCDPGNDHIVVYHIVRLYLTLSGEEQNKLLEQTLGLPHDSFFEAPKP